MHVYVHVPFCASICSYCDFFRYKSNPTIKHQWLETIRKEIGSMPLSNIDTLYFGGGTPSSLDNDSFEKLSKAFIPYVSDSYEWTVECNPESIDQEKVELYASLGVNRISLGVQSFQDDVLKYLGRHHTKETILQCIQLFHSVGIYNISIDLMYGLPHQTIDSLQKDLDLFLALDLPHLSIYSLQIEPNSIFGKQGIQPCDEDLEADMYERIQTELTEHGYEHYEISSYSKPGMYSKHNLCYWNDSDFVGIGCGASGRENGKRYDQKMSLREYIESGPIKTYVESDPKFEAIMMGLRTSFGLDILRWNQKYHSDFEKEYKEVLDQFKDQLVVESNRCFCTPAGLEILNTILVEFLEYS